jgi:hypothetical protein
MAYDKDVFAFIQAQETAYKRPIHITDSWDWSMADHIRLSVLYKNSQLSTGNPGGLKPIKNITRPILNLQYRAEGFDVKDITIFVDDSKEYYKSLLIRKFHEKWALENAMDTFIDSLVESYVDFGGTLIKDVNDVKPEVVPLQSIAFCDQTDILSGPIGIKHFYSPDQLLDMADKGWGDTANGATATLQETITLAREKKKTNPDGTITDTPGKYIEVYEIHGNMPKRFLVPSDSTGTYVTQLQIACFYDKVNGEKGNITLYRAEETKSPFKFIARDAVYGRALGFGGAEELFEPQVWINYDQIRKQALLDAAAVTILKSTDPAVAQKNKVRDMENLEIIELAPNTDISQVDTFPRNAAIFDKSVEEWEAHAQQMGAANDSIMGKPPASGTPFRLQELVAQEAHSLHDYRRGKLATFVDEIYRDWVIPRIVKEITQGTEFLAELDLDELQYVADALVTCETNDKIKQLVLSGKLASGDVIDPQLIEGYRQIVQSEFKKKGNKHFIQILKGEFKDLSVGVRTNVAGKQKDLAAKVDKLTNVFRTIVANPYILQSPPIAQLFNKIIEASGLDPIDLHGFQAPMMPTRRMTETIDYADLKPEDQKAMLQLAGIDNAQGQITPPQPAAH